MDNYKSFEVLLQQRRKSLHVDPAQWLVLDLFRTQHDEFKNQNFIVTSTFLDELLSNWSVVVNSDTWEIAMMGILLLNHILQTSSFSLYMNTATAGVKNNVVETIASVSEELAVHPEVRIRQSITLLITIIAGHCWVDAQRFYRKTGSYFLSRVQFNMNRQINIFQAALVSDVTSSMSLDDTTGWNDLETSLCSLQAMLLAFETSARFDLFRECEPEVIELIVSKLNKHLNRHVRQCSCKFLNSFIAIYFKDEYTATSATNCVLTGDPCVCRKCACDKLRHYLIDAIAFGLDENWGQIRILALDCAHGLLTNLQYGHRQEAFKLLLPRLCLNRHFESAISIEIKARFVWACVTEDTGRLLLEANIEHVTKYYLEMTKSNNHEVSEAACHAIAEVVAKLDKSKIIDYLPIIADALQACILDPSWPVRDAACVAAGVLVKENPVQFESRLSDFIDAWCSHLLDAISSIRENAAAALGWVLRAYSGTHMYEYVLNRCIQHITVYLPTVVNEETNSTTRNFLPQSMLMRETTNNVQLQSLPAVLRENEVTEPFEDKEIISRIDNSNSRSTVPSSRGSKWRKGNGWGCCLDCMTERSAAPWEISSGAVFLLKEVAVSSPYQTFLHFPLLVQMVELKKFKGSERLEEVVLHQILLIIQSYKGLQICATMFDDLLLALRRRRRHGTESLPVERSIVCSVSDLLHDPTIMI